MISQRSARLIAVSVGAVVVAGCSASSERVAPALGVVSGFEPVGRGGELGPPPRIVLDESTVRGKRIFIRWRRSRSLGTPWNGRLVKGVRIPAEGPFFFTWDPARRTSPNAAFRRYGNDRLVRLVLRILRSFAAHNPGAPRIGIGDLSRKHGGDFGPQFGGLGHSSHQNGLDVDIYYPRRDRRELEPRRPNQINKRLSQELLDRFVTAGALFVFVGPNTGLRGPPGVVQALPHHDNHMHVRIRRN